MSLLQFCSPDKPGVQKKICVVEFCPGGPVADIDFDEKQNSWGQNFFFLNFKQADKLKVFFLLSASFRHLHLAPLMWGINKSVKQAQNFNPKSFFKRM